jgi:hypothetical protein
VGFNDGGGWVDTGAHEGGGETGGWLNGDAPGIYHENNFFYIYLKN